MTVLVTGGAGFIGSHLVDALVARGEEVLVVDDLSSGSQRNLNPRAEFEMIDIRSEQAARLIRERGPRAICHLAAQVSVSRSVREPLLDADVNVAGTLNLVVAAAEVGCRFVFASTGGAIYGAAKRIPTPEDEPAWPVSPYGIGKLAAEHYLHGFREQAGLSYAALRYANVYGPRQDPHGEAGVVAIFSRALIDGRTPTIHGPGTDTRDYVFVGDIVAANLAALESDRAGHYNIGSGVQTDVNTLLERIAAALGVEARAEHGPPRAGDVRASALDAGLAERELGWRPLVTLEEGLRETAEWFKG
ncbi:MAG TPA: NAD-dependent epimerase/dehydratase family protein [Candidatus Dormibacteraeota bacterium]